MKFLVEQFTPRSPMGDEDFCASEPFLIREVGQYLINVDSIGLRWDVAWLQEGKCCQAWVLYAPPANSEPSVDEQHEWRETVRQLLKAQVPIEAQQFRLKLPVCAMRAAYL